MDKKVECEKTHRKISGVQARDESFPSWLFRISNILISSNISVCRKTFPFGVAETPSNISVCRKTFPFGVAESPKIVDLGGEVFEPKWTLGAEKSRPRHCHESASFASAETPPTCTSSDAGTSSAARHQ
jgi:hypothetical protein